MPYHHFTNTVTSSGRISNSALCWPLTLLQLHFETIHQFRKDHYSNSLVILANSKAPKVATLIKTNSLKSPRMNFPESQVQHFIRQINGL